MGNFVFTSPGVKFKERDLTFVTRNVGITTLGLVGETMKGPAFEPVYIEDKQQFKEIFGNQSTKRMDGNLQYQLPYVANAYLNESNQLWVTRVLGLSGYDAGNAWMLTLSAGLDPDSINIVSTITDNTSLTDNTYYGHNIYFNGQTGTIKSGYTKNNINNTFSQTVYDYYVEDYQEGGDSGILYTATTYTGKSYINYENMVLAIIRSNGDSKIPINEPQKTKFYTKNLKIKNNKTLFDIGDLYGRFDIEVVFEENGIDKTETYTVSLNPDDASFLPNVIGNKPKSKKTKIWVQEVYPELMKKLKTDDLGYGINTQVITGSSTNFTDSFNSQFRTPETPWVVSQVKGNVVDRLFKFISISDGNAANEEIKISIENIDPTSLTFDVIIRSFYDTDDNVNILKSFIKCSMIKESNNYIGKKIGTIDGEYQLKNNYIMVEIADNISDGVFPAGFEGYYLNDYSTKSTGDNTTTGISPTIFYKRSYLVREDVKKAYLGISEKGYGTNNGFNQNMFNYNGYFESSPYVTGFTKSKGFHMDITATAITNTSFVGEFDCGMDVFQTYKDIDNPNNKYNNIKTRKFTLVPAGGFDGWDVHRISRSNTDGYQQGGIYSGYPNNPLFPPTNDFQAWQMAIDTFANPEEVTINLFATPGINWADHQLLVKDTIEMIEEKRADSLYVIDSPDIGIEFSVGNSRNADVDNAESYKEALDLTEIDSSYSCTYAPWIQIQDTQNISDIYIPPTGEVLRAMAYTDKVNFPWYAPAGLNRGAINAKQPKYKLSLEARDILYSGRINPIAYFSDVGTAIFGQKTLKKKEGALDRINVRRLLLRIKVLISNIAVRLLFEQNDQDVINEFLAKANPALAAIKRERGLYDFKIKMDDTNNTTETRDRNELYGEIFLKPTRTLEYIGITFTITPSGASFEE